MLTRTDRLRHVVTCPRCGFAVWEPRLEATGCPTCRALDSRQALPLDSDEKAARQP